MSEEVRELTVVVEPGMEEGDQITFHGVANEAPMAVTGDVILVVKEVQHPVFRRRNDELLVSKDITLTQALVGFEFPLTHLDGRVLVIKTEMDMVVLPEDVKVIANEGMPCRGNGVKRGCLFVRFKIIFPVGNQISAALKQAYENVLPPPNELTGIELEDENTYAVEMQDSEIERFEQAKFPTEARGEASDEDDDQESPSGYRSSCGAM
jgi:DnaJ-class molecular chaperone